MRNNKTIPARKAALIFACFIAWINILLFGLYPVLEITFTLYNTLYYWIIVGYCLCLPMPVLAFLLARKEGAKSAKDILSVLNIRLLSKADWKNALFNLALVVLLSVLIYSGSFALNKLFGVGLLNTSVWFMRVPELTTAEKIKTLLIWLPMFCLNIFGEEFLWRGYIQTRLKNKQLWIMCSVLWWLLHAPFGMGFLILLIPIVIIIPYNFGKRKNALYSHTKTSSKNLSVFSCVSNQQPA
ncbi:MAG: CPBP family intramembrane metalloprotease [Clostridiales bacterium]|nr:CPBP family intramembrane metalloprotease [Clostridiales bacterium]